MYSDKLIEGYGLDLNHSPTPVGVAQETGGHDCLLTIRAVSGDRQSCRLFQNRERSRARDTRCFRADRYLQLIRSRGYFLKGQSGYELAASQRVSIWQLARYLGQRPALSNQFYCEPWFSGAIGRDVHREKEWHLLQ